MNKAELIEAVANEAKVTKTVAETVIGAQNVVICKALKKGEEIRVAGFGTLSIRKRAARTGTNPATGKKIKIAASKTVAFKPSKTLKEKL